MIPLNPETVIHVVCERLEIAPRLVQSSHFFAPVPEARGFIAHILHEECRMSYPQIELVIRPDTAREYGQSTWRYAHLRLRTGHYGADWRERVESIVKEARARDERKVAS